MDVTIADAGFFDVFGIRPVAGRIGPLADADAEPPDVARPLSPSAGPVDKPVAVDEPGARALGFASPAAAVGAVVYTYSHGNPDRAHPRRIVAVVPAVRQETARDVPRAQLFSLRGYPLHTLALRGTSVEAAERAVQAVWPRFVPDEANEAESVDDALAEVYDTDRRLAELALAASLFALALAGVGVYALAAHAVRRATREIVVRKLHGAGAAHVAALLAREFVPLLLAAAAIGLPAGAWLVHAWLAGFVDRAPFADAAPAIALLAVLAVAALAALRHAVAAMRLRPALVLRD
jgi:putative ABC transport system permease protein